MSAYTLIELVGLALDAGSEAVAGDAELQTLRYQLQAYGIIPDAMYTAWEGAVDEDPAVAMAGLVLGIAVGAGAVALAPEAITAIGVAAVAEGMDAALVPYLTVGLNVGINAAVSLGTEWVTEFLLGTGGPLAGAWSELEGGFTDLWQEFGNTAGNAMGAFMNGIAGLFNLGEADPILLDLGGSGVQLTSWQESNAHFDLYGTGIAV